MKLYTGREIVSEAIKVNEELIARNRIKIRQAMQTIRNCRDRIEFLKSIETTINSDER